MSKFYGSMVTAVENGGTIVDKIKSYDNYEEMVNDSNSGKYGICKDTNTVWHKTDNGWVVGFANIERDDYYTAFEVYPTSKNLEIGEYGQDGFTNASMILAKSSHTMTIRSEQLPSQQNVIIDWGDGKYDNLSEFPEENITGSVGDYRYRFVHEYTELDKKYIVKIFGNSYFSIMADANSNYADVQNNIMSRVFDIDLPIASHISNLSSFCKGAKRLLSVNVFNSIARKNVINWTNCFIGCYNLKKCVGWGTLDNIIACQQLFNGLTELEETDFRLPRFPMYSSYISQVFFKNAKLTKDVSELLPYTGFGVTNLSVAKLFANSGVTISDDTIDEIASKLWNNKNITWTNTSTCFSNCSDSTRAYVPESWGGTASDDIIEKTDAEKIAELTARLEALENN